MLLICGLYSSKYPCPLLISYFFLQVNVNMRPDTHVRVTVAHGEVAREEVIKVYQTVQQFKATLHGWFGVPTQNIKLYYCDKVSKGTVVQSLPSFIAFLEDTYLMN